MDHSIQFGQVQQNTSTRRQIEHNLVLRQEPNRSRMCGIGEKADRRPVDPPPIIQLHVNDPAASSNVRAYLHNPYYFMYATLMDEHGNRELNTLNDKKAKTMTGSVVASLAHLKDLDGSDGAFFVFPDLSVRCEGIYRLKFALFEIVGNQVFFCKSIVSDVFTVYSAKKFPGMEESTSLTKLFAEQGLKIRVRKEQKSSRQKGTRSRPVTLHPGSPLIQGTIGWGPRSDHHGGTGTGTGNGNGSSSSRQIGYSAQPQQTQQRPYPIQFATSSSHVGTVPPHLRQVPSGDHWNSAQQVHSGTSMVPPPPLPQPPSYVQPAGEYYTSGIEVGHIHPKPIRSLSPTQHHTHSQPTYEHTQHPQHPIQSYGYSTVPVQTRPIPISIPQHQQQQQQNSLQHPITIHQSRPPQPRMSDTSPQPAPLSQRATQIHRSSAGHAPTDPGPMRSHAHAFSPFMEQSKPAQQHQQPQSTQYQYRQSLTLDLPQSTSAYNIHRQQHQQPPYSSQPRHNKHHTSPLYTGHSLSSDARYSPYSRNVDGTKEARAPLSPGLRIHALVSSPTTENPPTYPDSSLIASQAQHVAASPPSLPRNDRRSTQVDSSSYRLTPVQYSYKQKYQSSLKQQQQQHNSIKSITTSITTLQTESTEPDRMTETTRTTVSSSQSRYHELRDSGTGEEPKSYRRSPKESRRIAVHSLLISESSSSPEKPH